jgi:hypothetical protein
MRTIMLILAVVALAVAAPAIADKGGNPNGGNGNGGGNVNGGGNGNGNRTSATLSAAPNPVHAGDNITVSGCGFDSANGGVVVGFTGGSWGQLPDAGGCINIAGIPTVAGVPLPPDTYPVAAYQWIDGKQTKVAETAVTVVE